MLGDPRIKAVVLLSLLTLAIGVPAVYYATTVNGYMDSPPVPVITAPDTVYAGSVVEFSAAHSKDDGVIVTYIWKFGDGTTSAGRVVNHTYTQIGNYTVTLIEYDDGGNRAVATKNITVIASVSRELHVNVSALLSNVSAYIGRYVVVDGVFAYGKNYSFYIVQNGTYRALRVYCEPGAVRPDTLSYGDIVEIRGLFTIYKGELELKVENKTGEYVIVKGTGGRNSYASISYTDWPLYNNSFVHLTANITEYYAYYKFFIGDVAVYIENGGNYFGLFNIGDTVEVYGFLTYYKPYNSSGYHEIVIRKSTTDTAVDLTVPNYVNVTVPQLLSSPDKYNNTNVHTTGIISWVYQNSSSNFTLFGLSDLGYELNVVGFNGSRISKISVGYRADVYGQFAYYKGEWEIKIRPRSYDRVIAEPQSYANITVETLLSDPLKYNNTCVYVKGVVADRGKYSNSSWTANLSNYVYFYISDNFGYHALDVFVTGGTERPEKLNNSDIVEIKGIFKEYRGSWEIYVSGDDWVRYIGGKGNFSYYTLNYSEFAGNENYYNLSFVNLTGTVVDVGVSYLFKIGNATHNTTVYVERGGVIEGAVLEGAVVQVCGLVTRYNGDWEIKVRNGTTDYVEVISEPPINYTTVNITELLTNASSYNGTSVYVPWSVCVSVYANWLFWVSNSSTNSDDLSVYVEPGGTVNGTVFVGAKLEIWGVVTIYNGQWEIKIRNGTSDGVYVINAVNYTTVNITELLQNTSAYNATSVHIPNATVVSVYATWLFWVSNSTTNSQDIAVYVQVGATVPTVGVGDIVEIYGNVTYHNGSYEIVIRTGTPDRVNVIYSAAKYVNISYIHEVNPDGTLVHANEQVIINATVISAPSVYSFVSSTGTSILKMYVEDSTGGVLVFGYVDYTKLNLTEGDKVQVRGTITQYNGEAELKIASLEYITYLGSGQPPAPLNLSTGYFSNWTNVEKIEGMLVHISGTVTDKYVGTTFVKITVNDGNGSVVVFIKNAWGIDTSNISVGDNISVVGVVSQYDSTSPYTSGYEILPRYQSDIVKLKVGLSNKSTQQIDEVFLWKEKPVLRADDI